MKEEIGYAPASLDDNEVIARVKASRGSLWDVEVPPSYVSSHHLASTELLVALAPKLHKKFFVRRGGLVVVSLAAEEDQLGKIQGEITNIVASQRDWERQLYFPDEFKSKRDTAALELPPSASDEDEDEDETDEY